MSSQSICRINEIIFQNEILFFIYCDAISMQLSQTKSSFSSIKGKSVTERTWSSSKLFVLKYDNDIADKDVPFHSFFGFRYDNVILIDN